MFVIRIKYKMGKSYYHKSFTADVYEEVKHLYDVWRESMGSIEVVEYEQR